MVKDEFNGHLQGKRKFYHVPNELNEMVMASCYCRGCKQLWLQLPVMKLTLGPTGGHLWRGKISSWWRRPSWNVCTWVSWAHRKVLACQKGWSKNSCIGQSQCMWGVLRSDGEFLRWFGKPRDVSGEAGEALLRVFSWDRETLFNSEDIPKWWKEQKNSSTRHALLQEGKHLVYHSLESITGAEAFTVIRGYFGGHAAGEDETCPFGLVKIVYEFLSTCLMQNFSHSGGMLTSIKGIICLHIHSWFSWTGYQGEVMAGRASSMDG